MKYAVTTPPSTEPVSLADAKVHLRTVTGDTSEDSAVISPLITAAREYCENFTRLSFAAQTVKAYPDGWEDNIRLPRPPIVSVTSIKYYDEDDIEYTLSTDDYQVDTIGGTIQILEEPTTTLRLLNPIVIEYSAGYTTLPKTLRQAMLLFIADKYQNRGDEPTEKAAEAIKSLLYQHKAGWQ
jgi:uncharacterized phiE125 gp8 family phage protein